MTASETTRELTIDEAVAVAIVLQQNDQLAEAGELYRRVLIADPTRADAVHYSGVLAHQQGRTDEAAALITRSLAMVSGNADWHSNLGIVLQSQGKLDAAMDAFRRSIELDPRHANAHSNLGVLLRAAGRPSEAEASYRAAIAIDPKHIDAYTNLGILLNSLRRPAEASTCFCKVITLRPKHRDARKLLALAHCALGETTEAIRIFEQWLEEEPDDAIARHMLAACSGRDVPPRASDGFVEQTFDGFAATFESKLQKLSYRAPGLVAAMAERANLPAAKALDVLDAGCGTGLCGPLLAPYARRLVGVDLSEGMLAHAREKRVYDELVKRELTDYLIRAPDRFDLIVSADALVYFGDLDVVVRAAASSLRSGGCLVFTLEDAAGREPDVAYRLETHGRYSHDESYVDRLLRAAGLAPEIVHAELRLEAGVPVAGLVVRATKKR